MKNCYTFENNIYQWKTSFHHASTSNIYTSNNRSNESYEITKNTHFYRKYIIELFILHNPMSTNNACVAMEYYNYSPSSNDFRNSSLSPSCL